MSARNLSRVQFVDDSGTFDRQHSISLGVGDDDDDDVSGVISRHEDSSEAPERAFDYPSNGYNLSYKRYKDPRGKTKGYYFTSPLGAPFPSYHSNPEAFFPPRWTTIRGDLKDPIENITAPRIRLAPKELEARHNILKQLQRESVRQNASSAPKPAPKVLNLCHQLLGDAYQFESLKLMLNLNSTVEILNLNDNELEDLRQLNLGNVRKLYLDQNSISSFWQIPPLPKCEELIVTNNFITGFSGLNEERFPKLKKLCVFGNPLCTDLAHRADIVKILPHLFMVDMFPTGRIITTLNVTAKDTQKGVDDETGCCA